MKTFPKPRPVAPYDVLEVSHDSGRTWEDFACVKTDTEIGQAKLIVDTDGACSGFCGIFRIVAGSLMDRRSGPLYMKNDPYRQRNDRSAA